MFDDFKELLSAFNAHSVKNDLIASKLTDGRMRGLADVEEIREAQSSQGTI